MSDRVHSRLVRRVEILAPLVIGIGLLFVAFCLIAERPAHAAAIVVDTAAPAINSDGLCSLIEALENADDAVTGQPHPDCAAGNPAGADTVFLAPITYTLTNQHNFTLYGGSGLPVIDTEITVEGNGAAIVRAAGAADQFRILLVENSGDLTLNDLTIGQAFNPNFSAGGIYNRGRITLNRVTLVGNTGSTGGGIENDALNGGQGIALIQDSIIRDNAATKEGGGGVWNNGTAVMTITRSLIEANRVEPLDPQFAIHGVGIANVVDFLGGRPVLTIVDSTIRDNVAVDPGSGLSNLGGGIYNRQGTLTIAGSTILSNTADDGGGGLANDQGTAVTILNSTISHNTAANGPGGGLHSFQFSGGTAVTLTHVTLTGNAAATAGGGIDFNGQFGAAALTLERLLLSGNAAPLGREANRNSGVVTMNAHNLFGFDGDAGLNGLAAGGTDLVPAFGVGLADILAVDPDDNGGPALSHALVAGGPAVDIAPAAGCPAVDQRGAARPGGSGCDAGALEFYPPVPITLAGALVPAGIDLSWTSSGDAGYEIWRSPSPGGGFVWIETTAATSATLAGGNENDPAVNDFYEIRGQILGDRSQRLGVFTFPIEPGD